MLLRRDYLFTEPEELEEGLSQRYNSPNTPVECNSDYYYEPSYFKEYCMRGSFHSDFNDEKHNESSGVILHDQFFIARSYINKFWCVTPL